VTQVSEMSETPDTIAETSSTAGPTGLPPLDVGAAFADQTLIVLGGTGFLGKVWLSTLLSRYPQIGRLYVVCRSKGDMSPEERFWADVAPSPVFDPVRAQRPGGAYEEFLRKKIVPIDGDMKRELIGIAPEIRDQCRGTLGAIVNVAGVVDFNPPLDEALEVNAFGAQNLVALARDLGGVPIFHTSTCFVTGCRDGVNPERNTLEFPFPRADELDVAHWDAANEIAECLDVVEQTRRRVEDAPRQSHLLDEAKNNLRDRGEPERGSALDDELQKVKRKFVRERLIDAGKERAIFWGWPNIYTYTKSIGEQVFLSSGLPLTIARPSIIESSLEFPVPGWCEGINTTTPFIYLALKGMQHLEVSEHSHLDIIPVDRCAGAMVAGVAALLQRRSPKVYQICTSDVNPLTTRRCGELIGLGKRKHFRERSSGNQLLNLLGSYTEPSVVGTDTYHRRSAPAVARRAKAIDRFLDRARGTQLETYTSPLQKLARGMGRQADNVTKLFTEFRPFTVDVEFRFSAKNTRALMASLSDEDQQRLPWDIQQIEWRDYWMDVHIPGVKKWSVPLLDDRLKKEIKPQRRHDDLVAMLEDRMEHDEHRIALQRLEGEQLTNIDLRDLWELSGAVASRLATAGITKGDRVALGGRNHPNWVVDYFGILRAGGVAIPVDKDYEGPNLRRVLEVSGAKLALLDDEVARPEDAPCPIVDLHEIARDPDPGESITVPTIERSGDDLASVLYTSGTTGDPKGVMLTHENFTALVAALAPLFPLDREDRMLSVLPLHHTFEFTCGLLLPLSRGARVIYLDEIDGERLATGLETGRVTSMVGVPALWELLERRIRSNVSDRGSVAEKVFDALLDFNRSMGRSLGFDLGRVLFGPVHAGLGGNLKTLISGAAALPPDVQKTFAGLGLHIAEGYGLTEAAPVLTVAKASARNKGGHVGKPIPGVELRVESPNDEGVGEILARGPNVMQGYEGDEEATAASIDEDGWLHTGDLGTVDRRGRVRLVGRSKEVIISTSGENVYPDDVEAMMGTLKHVKELSIVGIPDPRGGELVACLAVPDHPDDGDETDKRDADAALHQAEDRADRRAHAKRALEEAASKLPRVMRPTVIQLSDAELPRTATRKVKRKEVRAYIERRREAEAAIKEARREAASGSESSIVRSAVAAIARMKPSEIRADHDLAGELGFDSLMIVELVAALEDQVRGLDAAKLGDAKTVADVERLVAEASKARSTAGSSKTRTIERDEADEIIDIPDPVIKPIKAALTEGQFRFYEHVMQVKVRGRANVPHNRNTLVVANHASHVDMGLVKYALGDYGRDIVALAAQDYFFANKWRRAYFENFTNMAALDRTSGLRRALEQAGEHLQRGRTVLIFPEGTRSPDGLMRDFMPMIGHLAMNYETDILPVWVGGTFKAFPKGSTIPIPRRRKVQARIGPPLRYSDMELLTDGMKRAASYREVAKLAQRSVEALRDGKQIDWAMRALNAGDGGDPVDEVPAAAPMAELFQALEGRFVPGAVEEPKSFYFSLGVAKWNLIVDAERCVFAPGRPEGGKADCVLKTSEEIFTKIVNESYTPSVAEFMAGKVKSNDIALLQVFQKAFAL
jgi:long-chain acyl-CoA synthetase